MKEKNVIKVHVVCCQRVQSAMCTKVKTTIPIKLIKLLFISAAKSSIRRFVITEKAPTRAFSWLKAATTAFTFKTLLRHYAKQALTPRSLNVKLGPRRNYHKERAALRHYANQTARPLWPLRRGPNFTLRDRGVNAHLAKCLNSVLNVKAVVAAFNQEKALVGAFSVITNLRMELFQTLVSSSSQHVAAHIRGQPRYYRDIRYGDGDITRQSCVACAALPR